MYVETLSKVMCPRTHGPVQAPAHEFTVAVLNLLWDKFPRGAVDPDDPDAEPDDGEFVDPAVRKVYEVIAERFSDYMTYHVEGVSSVYPTKAKGGVARYLMCPTCGFVLPLTEADRDR